MAPFKWALLFYIFANVVYWLKGVPSISYSSSSTAAIGYLFLPLASAFSCLPWLIVGGSLGYGLKARVTRRKKHMIFAFVGSVLSLGYVWYATYGYMSNSRLVETVKFIEQMSAAELEKFVASSDLRDNKFALGAVCLNQQASAETLATIAAQSDPELYGKMWSTPEIMGGNRRGYAVMRLVAFHENVTEEILMELAEKSEPYLLGDIAGNSKTPQATLEKIYKDTDNNSTYAYLIEWGLSQNPNAPLHILISLANSRNQYTLRNLQNNPAIPAATHQEVVSRIQREDYD